jgi:hypothetical protein
MNYYVELSFIIRRYIEDRFDVRAPEMTTEEFLSKVKDMNVLSDEQKALLKNFLSYCDLIKFAKYGSTYEEMEASFESAKKFIGQTKEIEVSTTGRIYGMGIPLRR